jgi:hypothetical protein
MAIAAHINNSPGNAGVLLPLILRLAAQFPAQRFVIFVSKQAARGLQLPVNCATVVIKPPIRNQLLRYYWYQYKLPNLLEKYNVRYFLGEHATCNLNIKTPQALFVHTVPPVKKTQRRQHFARCLTHATALFVYNPLVEKKLLEAYPQFREKTTMLYPGLPGLYEPLEEAGKERILKKYTSEHEYFLYESDNSTADDKIVVLKAFSLFKKRLKSAMQLVIIEKPGAPPIPDFKNYKYKNEVKMILSDNEPESKELCAAAYAAIYLPSKTNTSRAAIHFLKSAVPLIVSDNEFNHLAYHDAVLYTQLNETQLAGHIMALYKDENLRKAQVIKGTELAARYNWEKSCQRLSETILPAGGV